MSEMPSQGTPPEIVIPPFQPSTQTDNSNPQVDISKLSDFAQGVLQAIPEADRAIMAKHLPTWDGNVTRKFQEIHAQYEPYKQLGDIADIQQAMEYSNWLANDPAGFAQSILEAVKEAGMSLDDTNEDVPVTPSSDINPDIEARFAKLETMMGNFFNQYQQFSQAQIEQQQMAELDKTMASLHSKHGQFDDEWVLLQMEKGMDPEKAIEAWQTNIIQKYGSQHRPAPVTVPTNGAVRNDQVDPSKFTKKDRINFGAEILKANM